MHYLLAFVLFLLVFFYLVGNFEIKKLISVRNVNKQGHYTFFTIKYSTQRCRFNKPKIIEVNCFVNKRTQATVNDGRNKKLYNQFLYGDDAIKAYAAEHGMVAILDNY